MAEALVTIVIPTVDRKADLLACLASIKAQTYSPIKVIVIDDGSQDGSVEAVHEQHPDVPVITLSRNNGSAKTSNAGFELALATPAAYILRLDSDTVIERDMVRHLVEAAENNAAMDVFTPKIYFHHDPTTIWFAGSWPDWFHFGERRGWRYQKDHLENSFEQEVGYVWSTALFMRRRVLEALHGFDTDFFVYFDDLEFCLRLHQHGFRMLYVPDAQMWHNIDEEKQSSWRAYHWNRSKVLLYRKHARSRLHRLGLLGYTFLYAFAHAILRSKRGGNRGPYLAALKGMYAGLRTRLS